MRGDAAVFAAEVVECAAEQGGFWPLHDRFMAGDETLFTEAGLRRQITFEGLDFGEFVTCMNDDRMTPLVTASKSEGEARGVAGTPTVFVNDEKVDPTYEAIEEAVREAASQTAQ